MSTDTKPTQDESETFSREYVTELRAESLRYRTEAQEAEKRANEVAAAADKAAQDAESAIAGANDAANARVIRAELKAEAVRAGMVDLDGLKLADLSTVKLNDDGTVDGASELMVALKKSKPYLFGTPSHSSTPGNAPPPKGQETKHASQMTDAEYAAARQKLVGGR